jgi:CO/xanthine dehydrogenase Mo-binding subunit
MGVAWLVGRPRVVSAATATRGSHRQKRRYGIRPGGEGGTTPALGAVTNAVVDALSELGALQTWATARAAA